ncbi:MAG TPA: nucleotidyltransferase family protein [Gemmatimonadaceae bacterium]
MIAYSEPASASLFFRVAAIPAGNRDWAKLDDARSIDWDLLIVTALLENSVTILNDRVTMLPSSSVPSEARARIGRLALVWTFKLQLLERRLQESVAALAAAGIEVTLLKGAALALTVYTKFSERPMADIDMMVDPSRAAEAHAILQNTGWTIAIASHPGDTWRDHHHLPPLADTAGSCLRLELHTAPLVPGHPFRLNQKDIVVTARPIDLCGIRVLVPEPHLHAVHLAIHFAYSHQFASGGLNSFRDLATMRNCGALTWEQFIDAAIQTRSESSCYWTLRLARSIGGLSVPDRVLERLSPQLGQRISAILEQHFSQLILRAEHACPSVELRNRLWALALQVSEPDERMATNWKNGPEPETAIDPPSVVRRVGAHLRRAPKWSRYVASLLGPALESFA